MIADTLAFVNDEASEGAADPFVPRLTLREPPAGGPFDEIGLEHQPGR